MRGLAVAFALLLAACTNPPPVVEPTPQPSREGGTLAVSVLLDLSGPRASIGTAQRNAIQLWLDQDRVVGTKPRVKLVDLASSDARLLVELRRAAEDDRADAVVVGAPFAYDETFTRALDLARVPVLLTLPAPEPAASAAGRWSFGLAPTPVDLARFTVDDAVLRRVLVPTLLVSDESPAAIAERIALGRELEARGYTRPTVVTVTAQDAAPRIRAGAALTRSILFAGAASTYLDAARSLASAGITPRAYLSYETDSADVSSLREAATMVTWPGSRNVATMSLPTSSAARSAFIQSYAERHGAPSTLAAAAFDSMSLLVAALESSSAVPSRDRLRDRLEAATLNGIATRYSFSPTRHTGFDMSDLAFLRWSATTSRTGIALAPEPKPKEER